jgi:hypothetical protein
MDGSVIASARPTRRGRRPWHVRTLFVRESGDLGFGQRKNTRWSVPGRRGVSKVTQLGPAVWNSSWYQPGAVTGAGVRVCHGKPGLRLRRCVSAVELEGASMALRWPAGEAWWRWWRSGGVVAPLDPPGCYVAERLPQSGDGDCHPPETVAASYWDIP